MGEYEPDDSRDVTHSTHTAPGEPPRTGPREDAARRRARQAPRQEQEHRAEQQEQRQDMRTAALEQGDPLGEVAATAAEAPDVIRLPDESARPAGGAR